MAMDPETRFARNGDVHLAYQVLGGGSLDLLLVDSWIHNVEAVWDVPVYARFLERLSLFSRLIHFDRRGTGLSDPVPPDALPDLETQVDDTLAVLAAAGSEHAAVLGVQDGGLVAMLLAAAHPARCRALVLYSGSAGGHAWPPEQIDQMAQQISDDLALGGGADSVAVVAPSKAVDARFIDQFARLQRASVRPGVVGHYFRQSMLTEVVDVLPTIRTETLFVHRTGDRVVPVESAREAAALVPGARLVELPGEDHLLFAGETDEMVDVIAEFLTGTRGIAEADRVLATLLFTDIVESTRVAAEVGDREWGCLLDEHDRLSRHQLERFGGREIDTTGDGFKAMFDGPGRAVRCAQAIANVVTGVGLSVRAGVHTGEIDLRGSDVGGLAVHIAARVAALAGPSEVLVSRTVKDLLVGSGLGFDSRGEQNLKGVPGTWEVFAVRI